jgi:hypothetical protein
MRVASPWEAQTTSAEWRTRIVKRTQWPDERSISPQELRRPLSGAGVHRGAHRRSCLVRRHSSRWVIFDLLLPYDSKLGILLHNEMSPAAKGTWVRSAPQRSKQSRWALQAESMSRVSLQRAFEEMSCATNSRARRRCTLIARPIGGQYDRGSVIGISTNPPANGPEFGSEKKTLTFRFVPLASITPVDASIIAAYAHG